MLHTNFPSYFIFGLEYRMDEQIQLQTQVAFCAVIICIRSAWTLRLMANKRFRKYDLTISRWVRPTFKFPVLSDAGFIDWTHSAKTVAHAFVATHFDDRSRWHAEDPSKSCSVNPSTIPSMRTELAACLEENRNNVKRYNSHDYDISLDNRQSRRYFSVIWQTT